MKNINRTFALVLGIVFVLIGILGFIPVFVPGGALLGIFDVNVLHNGVHLLFGVVGIAAALTGWPRISNQVVGIVYFLIGVLSFHSGPGTAWIAARSGRCERRRQYSAPGDWRCCRLYRLRHSEQQAGDCRTKLRPNIPFAEYNGK